MKLLSLLVAAALTLGLAKMYLERQGSTNLNGPSAVKAQLDDVRTRVNGAQQQGEERARAAQEKIELGQ